MPQPSLVQDLQSIVGGEHAIPPSAKPYTGLDGILPKAVVAPATYEETAAVLRYANENGLAVVPQGGRWFIGSGNMLRSYDIALSLTRLDQIVDHEPADMTVTCQAGISAGRLNTHLHENGQMVPLFSANPDDTVTVGGLLAMNVSRMVLQYGGPRDFTIGMRVVTADGRITSAGGHVVKNVAGYDMCKLHIGALGTLGVIVEATFKVFPVPQATERRTLAFESIDAACAFVSEAEDRTLNMAWTHARKDIERGDGRFINPPGCHLDVGLAGTAAAVERSAREIDEIAARSGVKPYESPKRPPQGAPDWVAGKDGLGVEVSVPRTSVAELVTAVENKATGAVFDPINPALGEVTAVWLGLETDEQEALVHSLRRVVKRLGGTVMVTTCSKDLKQRIDVFGDVPPKTLELMRRIKRQFDPNGILSPGRFVGRI
jgi:glycolate oxidase FAD binding subunit